MKKLIMSTTMLFFFLASWFGRYTPVQLDMSRPDTIQAEIKGEVIRPGVYQIPWNATVQTLVETAGGFTDTADLDAVNLSAVVKDREVVSIRTVPQTQETTVSLSSATLEELTKLPGVGPAIAQRILEYRDTEGFASLEGRRHLRNSVPTSVCKHRRDMSWPLHCSF